MNAIKEQAMLYQSFGLSIIPTKEDKSPAIPSWKEFQQRRMVNGEIDKHFGFAIAVGIVCGKISGNLEVIDIDCKYDKKGTLAKEFFELLKDNIPDVFSKLIIAQTKNKGWHIYYRCKKTEGNQKLAKNSNNEVLIETRGEGGYVIAPPSPGYLLKQGNWNEIPEISEKNREIIINAAKFFDETVNEAKDENQEIGYPNLSPFEDYNNRGDVVQLLQTHGWTITKDANEKVHLKRPGKTENKISGNWHTTKRIFFPFTTSTQFEGGKGYNAVQVYSLLECNDDLSEASRKLYEMDYGDRRIKPAIEHKPAKQAEIPLLPIEGFPKAIKEYLAACVDVYGTHRDFWAGALIAATALAIGDKLELKTKYENVPVLWFCLVGDVSSGKTEPIKQMLQPFKNLDSNSFKKFTLQKNEFERYLKMSKKEKESEGITEMEKPEFFQYLLNDFTPEAMADAHRINNRGIMIERDELKGWLDDFGRYNKSGEQSNMLSTFNRIGITYNRKGSGIIHIPKPTILVLGGMQPDLLASLAKDNRAENGFLSRMCMFFPDGTEKPPYNENMLPTTYFHFWDKFINELIKIPETVILKLEPDAKRLYEDWYNKNRDRINGENSGYLKGVYGKLDIISLRMAIVIKGMKLLFDQDYSESINSTIMQSAIEITEYFRATSLKVYGKIYADKGQAVNPSAVAKYLHEIGNHKTEIAKVLKTHRQQVQRWTK